MNVGNANLLKEMIEAKKKKNGTKMDDQEYLLNRRLLEQVKQEG